MTFPSWPQHAQRGHATDPAVQRAADISALTERFGEWYQIWWDGQFWAAWDGPGSEPLAADTRVDMVLVLADDMATRRDQARQAQPRGM